MASIYQINIDLSRETRKWTRPASGLRDRSVYGLFFHKPHGAAVVEKDAHAVIVGMELTAKPRDEMRNFEFATLPNGVR